MTSAWGPPSSSDRQEHAARLQEQVIAFVRAFGLLRPDATPCGRPLSVSEAHALLDLSTGEGMGQGALGRRLCLEKSTVSRLVAQLQGRGWVERTRDPADGRMVLLRLTGPGRRVAAEVAAARSAHFASLVARIPEAEREAVIRAFRVVARALGEPAPDHEASDQPGRRRSLPSPPLPSPRQP